MPILKRYSLQCIKMGLNMFILLKISVLTLCLNYLIKVSNLISIVLYSELLLHLAIYNLTSLFRPDNLWTFPAFLICSIDATLAIFMPLLWISRLLLSTRSPQLWEQDQISGCKVLRSENVWEWTVFCNGQVC